MKGSTKPSLSIVLTTFYLIVIFGSNVVLYAYVVDPHFPPPNSDHVYGKVNFTTVHVTRQSYSGFLKSFRSILTTKDKKCGIPILPDPSTVSVAHQFVMAHLSNWKHQSVELAIDALHGHVAGFGAQGRFYYFNNTAPPGFSNNSSQWWTGTLSFGNSYSEIEAAARIHRANVDLGIKALDTAISSLYINNITQPNTVPLALMVLIPMVWDAIRFKHIEQQVRWSIRSNRAIRPDVTVLSLQNKWTDFSSAIQKSNQGVFVKPVQLQSKFSTFNVDNVYPLLVPNLALMEFVCKSNDTSVCSKSEPRIRIVSRNNLCVDVRNEKYNDGNAIQVHPCKINNADVNQIWTLKQDGTIQSNGKCLTVDGFIPGSNVTIYNCTKSQSDAIRWQVWENGTIVNPKSRLVLTAVSGKIGDNLTIERNTYAPNQAWLASNNTKPFVMKIVGFKDLCLETNGNNGVTIAECMTQEPKQNWTIHADGTIRPQQRQSNCLTCENNTLRANAIIAPCDPGWSGQRWVFRNDGTILNLYSGMVMDVKESDPTLEQIVIWPATGNPNQKWLPLLL